MLFNEKEENIKTNINIEEIIPLIKSNPDFIYLIKSEKKNNYLEKIKNQYLFIPEFNIITLPERGLEFLNKTNGNCFYCNKKILSSFLCLLCGKKMCNSVNCIVENDSKKEYSLIYHSIKCSGGNGIFLDITNSEIKYLFKRRIINSNIFIYTNAFGEGLKDNYYLSDEYKINKDELNKGISKFIDMTYRKNVGKIYFRNVIN